MLSNIIYAHALCDVQIPRVDYVTSALMMHHTQYYYKLRYNFSFEYKWNAADNMPIMQKIQMYQCEIYLHRSISPVFEKNRKRITNVDMRTEIVSIWHGKSLKTPHKTCLSNYCLCYGTQGKASQNKRKFRPTKQNCSRRNVHSFAAYIDKLCSKCCVHAFGNGAKW